MTDYRYKATTTTSCCLEYPLTTTREEKEEANKLNISKTTTRLTLNYHYTLNCIQLQTNVLLALSL